MRLRGIGIDLGLTNGATVLVEADPISNWLTRVEVLAVWKRKRARRIKGDELYVNTKSTPDDIARFFLHKTSSYQEHFAPGVPVGIDWSPKEVFWGTSRMAAVLKSFTAGIIYRDALIYGSIPLFLPPAYLRKQLGLAGKVEKSAVWFAFRQKVRIEAALSCHEWKGMAEHEKDAVVLGFFAIVAFSQHLGEDNGRSPIS